MEHLLDCLCPFIVLLRLRVQQSIPQVDLTQSFCLLPRLRILDSAKLEPVLEFFHSQLLWLLNVLLLCKSNYVTSIGCLPLPQSDQLEIYVYPVVPHLDCWAEVAFRP